MIIYLDKVLSSGLRFAVGYDPGDKSLLSSLVTLLIITPALRLHTVGFVLYIGNLDFGVFQRRSQLFLCGEFW